LNCIYQSFFPKKPDGVHIRFLFSIGDGKNEISINGILLFHLQAIVSGREGGVNAFMVILEYFVGKITSNRKK